MNKNEILEPYATQPWDVINILFWVAKTDQNWNIIVDWYMVISN